MSESPPGENSTPPEDGADEWTAVVEEFRTKLSAGEDSVVEQFISRATPEQRSEWFQALLLFEILFRRTQGHAPDRQAYLQRYPAWKSEVESAFERADQPAETIEWGFAALDDTQSRAVDAYRTETWRDRGRKPGGPESLPSIPGYEVLGTIGRGGMGMVFKARHLGLQRLVALKLPLAGAAFDEDERTRFLREARASAQLRHAHICPIYDVGEVDGRPYMAMAYIDGPTLKQSVADHPPTAREAAEMTASVARAVGFAHDHDVIHRDIKPSNVMIDGETGNPVLMDFGLAKNIADQDNQLTHTGQVMGTPAYMAPEQAAGRSDLVGKRADVYALGAVLYELLTKRPPFLGNSGEVIHQLQSTSPAPVRRLASSVHRDLETICMKAMARDPSARYASAAELADDLERFNSGQSILARREHWISRASRFVRRNAKAAAAIALVLLVSAAAVGYFASGTRDVLRLSSLDRQFNESLQQGNWGAAHLLELEGLVVSTRELNDDAANRMEARLNQAYAAALRADQIGKPRLLPEDVPPLNEAIAWLDQRDPAAADALREDLRRRLRQWQEAFRLEPPFATAAAVWGEGLESFVEVTAEFVRRTNEHNPGLLTRVPCSEHAQLTASFSPSWRRAGQVGLILNGRDLALGEQHGYFFRVRTPDPKTFPTLGAATRCSLEIVRDGAVIRRESRRVAELAGPNQPLTIVATRENERLRMRVGDLPAFEFEDIFPLARTQQGAFGLILPTGVEVTRMSGKEQALPPAPSPLEKGDEHFARGQWDEALALYQEQSTKAADEATRELSRYKEAVCLSRLGRDDDAAQILESQLNSRDQRTPILAACQMWLLRLRQKRYELADVIFENVSSKYRFEDLALLVPSADREAIIRETYGLSGGVNLFRFRAEHLRYLERTVAVERLLERGVVMAVMREFQLLRGYHISDQLDRAIEVGGRILQDYEWDQSPIDAIVEEQSWLLRQLDRTDEALTLVRDTISKDEERFAPLRLELARALATKGELPRAEQEIQQLFDSPALHDSFRIFAGAHLVAGAIHHRGGRLEDARRLWKAGAYKNWSRIAASGKRQLTGIELEFGLMLAALGQECSAADLGLLIGRSNIGREGGFLALLVQQQSYRFAPYVESMGSRPEVIDEFSQIALRDCSLRFHIERPILRLGMEATRRGAAPGDWSEEENQAILEGLLEVMNAYREGQIAETHGAQLFAAWKGITGPLGWSGVAPQLPRRARVAAAYVFGHRMLRDKRTTAARLFFAAAARDAKDDSPLKTRAQQHLEKLR